MDKLYQCLDYQMKKHLEEARKMEHHFLSLEARRIPHIENHLADKLTRATSSKEPLPQGAFLEVIKVPSIKEDTYAKEELALKVSRTTLTIAKAPTSWMTLIIHAIKGGIEDDETPRANTLLNKARMYAILSDVL